MTTTATQSVDTWLAERLPGDWFTGTAEVTVDRDEILVIGTLPDPADGGEPLSGEVARDAQAGRIARFREETREARITIAREAERRFDRTVSWGARCGETTELFTTTAVPVMTRLRQPERVVLDTLVSSGVARSRSDALGWCVRLVAEHSGDWLSELREALSAVERVRAEGPGA